MRYRGRRTEDRGSTETGRAPHSGDKQQRVAVAQHKHKTTQTHTYICTNKSTSAISAMCAMLRVCLLPLAVSLSHSCCTVAQHSDRSRGVNHHVLSLLNFRGVLRLFGSTWPKCEWESDQFEAFWSPLYVDLHIQSRLSNHLQDFVQITTVSSNILSHTSVSPPQCHGSECSLHQ